MTLAPPRDERSELQRGAGGPQELFHLAFSDDGRTLAAATYDAVFLWYAASDQEVAAQSK